MNTPEVRQKLEQLNNELENAQRAMRQLRPVEVDQALFRAKSMASGLLRELEEQELREIFRASGLKRTVNRIRNRFFNGAGRRAESSGCAGRMAIATAVAMALFVLIALVTH